MDPTTILLLAVVILGSAYAGYLIGRWSVLSALEDVANRIDPDVDEHGRASRPRATPPPGPAAHSETTWSKRPVKRTAKPPPALAGDLAESGSSGQASSPPSARSKRPPAAAG